MNIKCWVMRSRILNEKETRNLVWFTWFAILVVGMMVYFLTNPIRYALVFLSGPILICTLINFWVKSVGVTEKNYSVIPLVFGPTAFLTGFGALLMAFYGDGMFNSWTLALAVVCVSCLIAVYPESRYADYIE